MPGYTDKIDHDIDATGDLEISGQMNGNLTVHDGSRVWMGGQTNGNVLVLDGGFLHQTGQLNGTLTCRGWADITGQINGSVFVDDDGVVLVAEGVQRNTADAQLVLDSSGEWVRIASGVVTVVREDSPRWQWNQDGSLRRYSNS